MRPFVWLVVALGLLLAGAAIAWLTGARPGSGDDEPAVAPWFQDVTEHAGLHFNCDTGRLDRFFMPAIMGAGGALIDCDGDGRLDVYLVHISGPEGRKNQLFRQRPDGTFEDVSAGSGLDVSGYGTAVAVGDVNNDGRPDVLLGEFGRVRLFLNEGGGKFREATEAAGLSNPNWTTALAFVDYDRDGWLDLVVVNYIDYDSSLPCTAANGAPDYCNPKNFPGTVTRLFRNRGPQSGGNGVKFDEVTVKAGLAQAPGPGLGVYCADFNGDRWPDIFVANDGRPNHLWINQKDGTFKEEAAIRNVAYNGLGHPQANMGTAFGDVDGDGLMDLFVTHITYETHTLWKQGPRGYFKDVTGRSGLAAPRWQGTGFGTVLADFDHDGALDLAIVNGHVARQDPPPAPELGPHWGMYGQRNQLFANDGTGRFRDVSAANPAFCGHANVGRALIWGDIFGSGAIDLLVTDMAGPARLFRNVAPRRGHWLAVRVLLPSPRAPADPKLDRDAYGAEVTVRAGPRRWVRLVSPADSYMCSSDARAHFGVGDAERVDAVEVLWPDGRRESFPGGPADRHVTVRRGQGAVRPSDPPEGGSP